MKVATKEKVDKYIYRQIVTLSNGDKLPSVRKMMKDCNTSQLTIQTVLKRYEQQNLIKSSNRRGFFKIETKKKSPFFDELDLIYCTSVKEKDPLANFHVELSHLLAKFCGENWRSVRMHFLEGNVNNEDVTRIAESSRCRACIVISSPSHELGRILEEHHITYINLFPQSPDIDQDAVNIIINNEDVLQRQLDHLLDLGHKKIAYLHSLNKLEIVRDLLFRKDLFKQMALKKGLPLKPHWVQFGGYDTNAAIKAMRKVLSGKEKPTAVIASDYHIPGIYSVLNEFGLEPGKDFSVVGTDNLIISRIISPPATTLDISREHTAELALTTLMKLLEGKSCENTLYINSDLIIRESTAPLIHK